MKVFEYGSRQEYVETQIERSVQKFEYCKVSVHDVIKYRRIIKLDLARRRLETSIGPILCLGTRNGRELDLFRTQFFGPGPLRVAVRLLEHGTHHAFVSRVSLIESIGRSSVQDMSHSSVVGVEINPQAARQDIWIGSFDELPAEWAGRFGLVYSNSLDHAQDPYRAAREWNRVIRKDGYLILCYAEDKRPLMTDPVGELDWRDVLDLFGGEMIYFAKRGSRAGYSEVILRLGKS